MEWKKEEKKEEEEEKEKKEEEKLLDDCYITKELCEAILFIDDLDRKAPTRLIDYDTFARIFEHNNLDLSPIDELWAVYSYFGHQTRFKTPQRVKRTC